MPDGVNKARLKSRKRMLLGTLGIVLALALSFCGWVYKAKTQRDLNMQLLGAVRRGNAEAARLLLKRGADPNIRDVPQQQLSLWQQIQHAFHKKSQPSDDQNYTLLEMAMTSEEKYDSYIVDVALVKTVLEAGARPNDCYRNHTTPLMTAVVHKSPQTVQMLLDHGANPLAKDDDGRCPIHYVDSFQPNALKIVELLIKGGEDVNAADNFGETALLQNCSDGNIDIVRFLIVHGAQVDVHDNNGNTPLINCFGLATGPDLLDILKLLIAHGADVNYRNKDGDTPLSLAKEAGDKQSIRLLEAAGAKQ